MFLCKVAIIFLGSLFQASFSTLLALLFALPLAHFFYTYDFGGKHFFIGLASMLCIMPTKLVALCIQLFFGASGFTGIILAHLMLNIPLTFYILHLTYQKIDVQLFWLAQECGASFWQCYKDIYFPILKPTLISVFLLLFLLHFASFSIPLMLGTATWHHTPEIVISQFYSQQNNQQAFVLWLLRLAIIIPLFFVHNRLSSRLSLQKIKISSIPLSHARMPLKKFTLFTKYGFRFSSVHVTIWLFYLFMITVLTICPLFVLLIKACNVHVYKFFYAFFFLVTDPILHVSLLRVIVNSIVLAFVSSIGSVLFAFLLAFLEFRAKKRIAKHGISLLTIFTFLVGSVGIGILFASVLYGKLVSSFASVLCHIMLNYAFAYRIIRTQMALYHPDFHKTAQTYGATPSQALFTIALPFVFPALVKAFCICFGLSLTEVGAGTVLRGKMGLTIPIAIRIYRRYGCQEAVIGTSLILLGLVLLVTYFFSRKYN